MEKVRAAVTTVEERTVSARAPVVMTASVRQAAVVMGQVACVPFKNVIVMCAVQAVDVNKFVYGEEENGS